MDYETNNQDTGYTPRPRKSFLSFLTLGMGIFGFLQPLWAVAAIVVAMIDKSRSDEWSTQSKIGFWLGVASTSILCFFCIITVLIYLIDPGFSATLAETLPALADYGKMFGYSSIVK